MEYMENSVIYKNGAFYASKPVGLFTVQELKKSGWKHNNKDGWFTTNLSGVALLSDYADDKVLKILKRNFINFKLWKGTLLIPNGLTLLKHQPDAIKFSLNRDKSYLALAPGLGKTIVAAIIAATLGKRTLIVCPPFLTINTYEEFIKWAPKLHTKILDNVDYIVPDVLIVPDSMITNLEVRKYIRAFEPEVFIGDEWHRYKTDTAQRSKAVFGFKDNRKKISYSPGILDGKHLKKIILMSGTPMPNRPIELFTTLKKCAGQFINFRDMNSYGMKYCGGFAVKNPYTGQVYGNDLTGCNEKEFTKLMNEVRTTDANNMSAFMLRQDKSILKLPKLTEEMLILGLDMPKELSALDGKLLRQYSPQDLIKYEIKKLMGKSNHDEDIHIMTYRRLLGLYKVKPSVEYLKSILEETNEAILAVAIHKEVIAELEEKLSDYNPMVITGNVQSMKRQKIVKEFQQSKNRRIMLGNIDAIGVGFNITKVNRITLIEYLWSPGSNRQVIDRGHRYGLKHPLLAQYFVFRNSLDRSTIETLLYKEKLIKLV